jgi:transcriptional regulator with XRE-family HTH domain
MADKKTVSPLKTMGESIQQLRKNAGFTQADLAKKIGISHAQIARYEIKDNYPAADVLKVSADVFGTTIDFLVMGDTENQFKTISVPRKKKKS